MIRRLRCRAGTCPGSSPPCTGLEARMGKNKREYVQVLARWAMSTGLSNSQTRGHRLRCGQASRPLPDRETPTPARSRYLPLPAQSTGRDHQARELYEPDGAGAGMTDTPQVLLQHHLKKLRLPTFLGEYSKLAQQCAAEKKDHVQYLLRLCELDLIERERRMIPASRPRHKSSGHQRDRVTQQAARAGAGALLTNTLALGPSGTGKTHVALGLGARRASASCITGSRIDRSCR